MVFTTEPYGFIRVNADGSKDYVLKYSDGKEVIVAQELPP